MAQQYIEENFPAIDGQSALITRMPAETVRDFRSDWAKSKASPWNNEARWTALVNDLDAVGASSTQWHRDLFDLLLEQLENPSDETMRVILDMESFNDRIKEWNVLFGALAFVLLSPIQTLPLLLRSHHLATEQLVMRHSAQLSTLFHELANAGTLMSKKMADKKAGVTVANARPAKKKGRSTSVTNDKTPTEQAVHWTRYDLFASIDNLVNAKLIYSLIAENDQEKMLGKDYVGLFMTQAAFDDGWRIHSVILMLIRNEDQERVLQWLAEHKDIEEGNSTNYIIERVLQSRMEDAIRYLVANHGSNEEFHYIVAGEIDRATISLTALRVITSVYGDKMDELWDRVDQSEAIANLIQTSDTELLDTILKLGFPLRNANITIGDNDATITPLEYALRFADSKEMIQLLLSYYTIDPMALLMLLMTDNEKTVEVGLGVEFMLDNYEYTKEELIMALKRSKSPSKSADIIKRLFPEFQGVEYNETRPAIVLKNQ